MPRSRRKRIRPDSERACKDCDCAHWRGSAPSNNRIRRCRFWRAGNSNLGHDYGNAQFTEEERWALVEYMKAVGAKRVGDRVVP